MIEGDRPSRHGAMMGETLADIAAEGRKSCPPGTPEPCLTCAFRKGTQANQSAGTGVAALNCVLDIDTEDFACHHGMKDGRPTKLCAGYVTARLAPFQFTTDALAALVEKLKSVEDSGPDEVRETFDAWLSSADPAGVMDVYQQARARAKG